MKYLIILLFALTSCSEYDGPLYRVVVQHTAIDFEQRDTLIMGQPSLNNYTLIADVPGKMSGVGITINNVRSFEIIGTIETKYTTLKPQPHKCSLW